MEILNTTEHIVEFWFNIVFIGGLALIVLILVTLFYFYMFKEREFGFNTITPAIIFTLMWLGLSYIFVEVVNQGVEITYEVKVYNWNEVYDRGYEVIKQDGELATIELKGE